MSKVKENVQQSAPFYNKSMLNIDYKQVEFCYRSFRKFFKGTIACELGPSTGYMTRYLLNDFSELDVVEGSKNLLDQIPDHVKLKKYHSLFEDFTPSRKYDTIIMSHVLEHIEQPVEVVRKISNWLGDDGVFIICVPNAKSFHRMAAVKMGLLNSEYELNERDKQLGHYRIYDFKLLIDHSRQAGLEIISSGGVFLKFVSNKQIEDTWNDQMIEAYYQIGEHFQENAAEIYIVCKRA
jgi:SAM-dependent methyltransferase